jgi:hypothetical protein
MWEDESMPKRSLHFVKGSNPLFAVCERCNARFTSFASSADEAEKQVKAAFEEHECEHGNAGLGSPEKQQKGQ